MDRLTRLELPVNRAMKALLEPGDRRFMALGWAEGLCVYDGWTEYTLENLSPQDIFGDHGELVAAFRAGNSHHGCESVRILIDFAQGTIYAGDEEGVENFLEEMVDEQYRRSPLCTAVGSLDVWGPLDGHRSKAV